ncbi:MAG: hypothetical protein IPI85_17310 [Dehalococcoidia bacterium]|nr:hypothetical protein [Dehalococcoidia bacterium]
MLAESERVEASLFDGSGEIDWLQRRLHHARVDAEVRHGWLSPEKVASPYPEQKSRASAWAAATGLLQTTPGAGESVLPEHSCSNLYHRVGAVSPAVSYGKVHDCDIPIADAHHP